MWLVLGTLALAGEHKSAAGVVLFEPHPSEFFAPDRAPARLSSLAQKLGRLRHCGLDFVVVLRFDQQLAQMAAPDFVRKILCARLGMRGLLIGDDWRFGRDRAGDFALLCELQEACGYVVRRLDTVLADDQRISSSRIRACLAARQVEQANALLGRCWAVVGRVVAGAQLGRTLGAPTANIHYRRALPLGMGVYMCWLDGRPAVANYGTRPTVDGGQPMLEVHVLDQQLALYNRRVTVEFGGFLRPEQRFADLEALREQIHKDMHQARQWHRSNPYQRMPCA